MRRTLFAGQLINETRLPMTEIAISSGFSSQRRFNACIREVYGRPPSALRRWRTKARLTSASAKRVGQSDRRSNRRAGPTVREEKSAIELTLRYRPPFAWQALLDFFRDRAIPGVEIVTDSRYLRTIRAPGGNGSIAVENDEARRRLRVSVRMSSAEGLIDISARLRQLFDLDADADAIDTLLGKRTSVPGLQALRTNVARWPGMRVPGAYDGFETAVRGILGQQVSVKGATTIAGRVATRWGTRLPRRLAQDESLVRIFPTARRLVEAELEEVGIIRARANTIRGLAQAVLDDPTLLQPGVGLLEDIERWVELPGIGPWTANYVAMRVLREPDALPAADLVLRKAISKAEEKPRPASDVEKALESYRPYRAYAAIRLWSSLRPDSIS